MAQITPQQAGGADAGGTIRSEAKTASGKPVWQFSKHGELYVRLCRLIKGP